MPTPASNPALSSQPPAEWDLRVTGNFGDPDDGPTFGITTTVRASGDVEAETRALASAIFHFEDDFRDAVATSEGPTSADGQTYAVRIDMKWGPR